MDLRDYLSLLRQRRWVMFIAVSVVVAAAVGVSLFQTPVYAAHSRVVLQASRTVFEVGSGQQTLSPVRAQTEIQIIESAPVRDLVRERLGVAPRPNVRQVGQTDVIEIGAESTDPKMAANIANAYAESYIEFRRNQAVENLLAAGEQISRKVADLQKQIDEVTATANAAFAAANANRPPNAQLSPPTNPERDALVNQQALFKQRLDQLQVDAALKDGGAQMVAPAVAPLSPVRPTPVRNAALGLGAGIVLALAAAFVIDHLDDSIKTEADLERAATDVSLLGVIPAVPWKDKEDIQLVSLTQPDSPAAEAYRALRTSITFLGMDRKLRVLQVTSPGSSEGKTTTLANLAVAMAGAGQRVVLVDCDLRRPRLHEFFGLKNELGFTSVLTGQVPLAAALHEVAPRILVLTAGPRPTNPSELLSSNRAGELLRAVAAQSDFVLVDCPPILPVTDAAVLSAKVDGTVLVANAGATSTKDVGHALDRLRRVAAPVIGAVLNGATGDSAYGYSYSYQYGVPASGNGKVSTNGNGKADGATVGQDNGSRKRSLMKPFKDPKA